MELPGMRQAKFTVHTTSPVAETWGIFYKIQRRSSFTVCGEQVSNLIYTSLPE